MKKALIICAASMMVSACGGGGGDSSSPTAPVAAAPVNKLAAYVGTWVAGCDDHELMEATITSPAINTLKIAARSDYYAGANCTGAIVATETESGEITATYVETIDSSIVLSNGAVATPGKVDKITASRTASTRSITGTGVTRVIANGQPQWCINFGNGSQSCVRDEGTDPAQSGIAGGLYIQGNVFYELLPKGSLYEAYGRYTKK